jgi:chorismate mutase
MRGIRGATQIAANSVAAMEEAVVELCREIEQRNEIGPADIVWAIFTVTRDLDADFPARAARVAGWTQVPMICSQEIPVPGSMPRIVRVLLHVDSAGPRSHVYLRGAQALRPDLHRQP